jgi:2-C-methyl-D-erythritol 2,4-cyclodiphosphate synthase
MCERPKVNPHKDAMKVNIARVLGLHIKQIGIKGTTTEKLGFTGRGEGIASQAVAMVRSL